MGVSPVPPANIPMCLTVTCEDGQADKLAVEVRPTTATAQSRGKHSLTRKFESSLAQVLVDTKWPCHAMSPETKTLKDFQHRQRDTAPAISIQSPGFLPGIGQAVTASKQLESEEDRFPKGRDCCRGRGPSFHLKNAKAAFGSVGCIETD